MNERRGAADRQTDAGIALLPPFFSALLCSEHQLPRRPSAKDDYGAGGIATGAGRHSHSLCRGGNSNNIHRRTDRQTDGQRARLSSEFVPSFVAVWLQVQRGEGEEGRGDGGDGRVTREGGREWWWDTGT